MLGALGHTIIKSFLFYPLRIIKMLFFNLLVIGTLSLEKNELSSLETFNQLILLVRSGNVVEFSTYVNAHENTLFRCPDSRGWRRDQSANFDLCVTLVDKIFTHPSPDFDKFVNILIGSSMLRSLYLMEKLLQDRSHYSIGHFARIWPYLYQYPTLAFSRTFTTYVTRNRISALEYYRNTDDQALESAPNLRTFILSIFWNTASINDFETKFPIQIPNWFYFLSIESLNSGSFVLLLIRQSICIADVLKYKSAIHFNMTLAINLDIIFPVRNGKAWYIEINDSNLEFDVELLYFLGNHANNMGLRSRELAAALDNDDMIKAAFAYWTYGHPDRAAAANNAATL
eukprot:NODE_275_length_12088_cov_0.250813.p5 type:complete len:343 gc:universal NODE_275_length_12088_cov_0.250813:506-1534(+)